MHASSTLDAVRRPEYTGENRCLPCTVVNVAIAAALAAVVGVRSLPAGVLLFAASLAAIYLRGYLVPGTPALTKRYAPDRVLALFDKSPDRVAFDADGVDPRAFLFDADLIRDDDPDADVELDPDFEAAWNERMDGLDGDRTGVADFADLIGVPAARLDLDGMGGSAVVARADGERVGTWESRAAFVADVTAARELDARVPAWREMPLADRSRVLAALRLFVERCPDCRGHVELDDEVVESCCRSRHVVAATCADCGARVIELDVDPGALDDDEVDDAATGATDDDGVVEDHADGT